MSEPKKLRKKDKEENEEKDPTLVRDDEALDENTERGSEDTTVTRGLDEAADAADELDSEEGARLDEDAAFHAEIAQDPTAVNLELRRRMLEESDVGSGGTEEIPEFDDDNTTLLGVTLDGQDDTSLGDEVEVDFDEVERDFDEVEKDFDEVEEDFDVDDVAATELASLGDADAQDDDISDDDTTIIADEYASSQLQTELAKTIQRPGAAMGTAGFTQTEHLLGGREGILKGRFVLEERLGSGGMGTVYRAQDLRKVEARDRNPYVAVKVLNDDFKRHPDAFIALQREAAKSQALSHPNIVRIFDFDKDGDTPFMTMELLEGAELADLLREAIEGLPRDQGWKILRGMCSGLQRAHEAGITHSDFKPGNVFVSADNVAKILDFGIARAVQDTADDGKDDGDLDKTLFDPGTLGALTPAYASLEMLNGEEPDARDDIYGLALVAYLIFTGRHPFDRKPADEAREDRLRPKRIQGLTGRQWRAIERGLQFEREHRLDSVEEFSQLLFEKPRWAVRPAVAAAAVVAMVAVITGSMMLEYAAQGNRDVIAAQAVMDAQLADIDAMLQQDLFDQRWEDQLFIEVQQLRSMLTPGDPRADDLNARILSRYLEQVRDLQDDFDSARSVLDRARRYTSDGQYFSYGEPIIAQALKERITALLASPAFTAAWEQRLELELSRGREYLRDGGWVRDTDKRALELYRGRATRAIDEGDLDMAEHLIEVGSRYADPASFAEQTAALTGARATQRQRLEREQLAEQDRRRQAQQRREAAAAQQEVSLRDAQFVEAFGRLEEELQCGGTFSVRRLAPMVAEMRANFAGRFAAQEGGVVTGLAGCISEVMQSDVEKARSARRTALQVFPGAHELEVIRFDPCGARYLVGNGNSGGRGGYCEDALSAGMSGPRLVVIPENGEFASFAIGKYEVSVADLNAFCEHNDACVPSQAIDERLPAAQVDVELASAYIHWLSEQSGYAYRLPSVAEWRHAAHAMGSNPDPNRNCTMNALGIRKGDSLQNVRNGRGNEWGLINHLGNVQEWALEDAAVMAMGGAHVDAMGDCTVELARAHGGQADGITGFRVVRDLR